MDCNCEGYIGRVYRVISEAYPSTARSRIKSSFLCRPTCAMQIIPVHYKCSMQSTIRLYSHSINKSFSSWLKIQLIMIIMWDFVGELCRATCISNAVNSWMPPPLCTHEYACMHAYTCHWQWQRLIRIISWEKAIEPDAMVISSCKAVPY